MSVSALKIFFGYLDLNPWPCEGYSHTPAPKQSIASVFTFIFFPPVTHHISEHCATLVDSGPVHSITLLILTGSLDSFVVVLCF